MAGITNNVPFGVRNEDFERVGRKDPSNYDGEGGLLGRISRASEALIQASNDEAKQSATERFRAAVMALFDEFEGDAAAVANATSYTLSAFKSSYNSLHLTIPNPGYIPPTTTVTRKGDYTIYNTDWSTERNRPPYFDVSRQQLQTHPELAGQLIIQNEFHL